MSQLGSGDKIVSTRARMQLVPRSSLSKYKIKIAATKSLQEEDIKDKEDAKDKEDTKKRIIHKSSVNMTHSKERNT